MSDSTASSEVTSPEVTVIEVGENARLRFGEIDNETGMITFWIGPNTQLRGERNPLIEYFAEAGIALADSFLDDLEASARRSQQTILESRFGSRSQLTG